MAIYRCLLRISNNLAWKSRSEMLSRQGFQLPESLRLLYQRFISNLTRAYTDFWQAYKTVIPPERHRAVGKETGLTNHIERLNNTNRAAGFSTGKSKPIILQKVEQSHWGDLVLHSWLQRRAGKDLSFTTTSISLPRYKWSMANNAYSPQFIKDSSRRKIMNQRLKRWESPRRQGRNDKGKGGAALFAAAQEANANDAKKS